MKSKLAVLMVLAFGLLSTSLFAATKNSDHVTFFDPVTIGSTQVAPGEYKVVWDGTGPDVQVSFVQGKKTVATAPARLAAEKNSYSKEVNLRKQSDNSQLVTGIKFKNVSLSFNEATPASGN